MKKLISKIAILSAFGLTAASAVAGPTYSPTGLTAKDVKLVCTTPATCGSYTATHDLTVRREGSHIKLWWNLNEPSGVSGGRYKALTVGADCPAGSPLSRMEAQWTVNYYLMPSKAVATHCDGVTTSEFDVIMRDIGPIDPFQF